MGNCCEMGGWDMVTIGVFGKVGGHCFGAGKHASTCTCVNCLVVIEFCSHC
jgi:hypothetical protein